MDKAPLGHKGSLQKCERRASAPTGVQSEGAVSAGLDKSQGAGIIKITQGPATSGFASDYALVTKKSKPSLGRVAVSACNADRHRKTKKVKRDRYRHIHPPFRETKPPIAVLGPQGFHRTGYILPNKLKNVNKCSPLVKGEHLLYTYLFTHTHTSPGRRLRRRRWRILCRRGA